MGEKAKILFFEFFTKLRKSGIELDLAQYQDFIHMVTTSEYITNATSAIDKRETLFLLSKTLWLTRVEHANKFNSMFEEAYREIALEGDFFPDESKVVEEINEKDEDINEAMSEDPMTEEILVDSTNTPETSNTTDPIQNKVTRKGELSSNAEECSVFLNFREGHGEAPPLEGFKKKSKKESSFIFSDEKHLPFSTRKAKQLWRKLQYESTEIKSSTQIDVQKLVNKIAKEKILSRLEYKEEKSFNRNMILLIDHSGAMIAFEAWLQQFKDILSGSIAGKNLTTYYFYNVPVPVDNSSGNDYIVFDSPLHLRSTLISEIVSNMKRQTDIVIFSDAGVFENSEDHGLAGTFFKIHSLLKRRTNKILWVNPFNKDRWVGNTAEMITSKYPMISYDLDDMKEGIKMLRID